MTVCKATLRQMCGLLLVAVLGLLPALVWAKPTSGLVLAAQVWGLAKYHAPDVTACKKDWDQVLLDEFAQLETAAAGSATDETVALNAMVAAAGTVGTATLDDSTPAWIRDSDIGTDLKQKLAWLALQRPNQQCYVSLKNGFLDFSSDNGHDVAGLPDRAHRALAAFRFWNVIRYFYPYKRGIGRDWAGVLDQWLRTVLKADNQHAYLRALRGFTAAIKDGHDFLYGGGVSSLALYYWGPPPFLVRRIQGKPVVALVLPQVQDQVQPGDVVLGVDGESVADRMAKSDSMSWGANPAWRDAQNLTISMSSSAATGSYRLRRPDGSVYTVQVQHSWSYDFAAAEGIQTAWATRALPGGCKMGIVNMGRLQSSQVDEFVHAMADVDAIVVDSRNYPNATLWPLANDLFPQPREIARFDVADLHHPGTFQPSPEAIGGQGTALLAHKRLLVLVDDRTMSQAEYTVMGLQATGNAIVFGSQTSGSDGNILNPPLSLPGDLTVTFTGLGTSYPDGTPTQRIGIVPDVQVTPTIAGLAAGKDEVLDAALNCQWVHARPLRRMPVSGVYADASRQGESVDVHYDGRAVVAFAMHYDEQGQPSWLLAAAPAARSADWGTKFYSYQPGTADPVHAAAYSINFYRGPYTPPCAIVDQSKLFPRALWKSPGTGSAGHCVTPSLLSTGGPAAGVWTGPDGGWALSIQPDGKTLHVHLYGFDQQGNPRWLEGTGPLGDDGVADVALQRVTGYCDTCAPTVLTEQPAGTIRLTVDAAAGGALSADISAMFGSQGTWTRTAVPLHQFVAMDQPVRAAIATLRVKPVAVPTGLRALTAGAAGSP